MRVFLVLLEGRDGADPLFLQIKQAGSSVYEAYLRSQPAPEPRGAGDRRQTPDPKRDRHLRRLHLCREPRLLRPSVPRHEGDPQRRADSASPGTSSQAPAAKPLARAHARTGDPIAIAAYIGKGRAFRRGASQSLQSTTQIRPPATIVGYATRSPAGRLRARTRHNLTAEPLPGDRQTGVTCRRRSARCRLCVASVGGGLAEVVAPAWSKLDADPRAEAAGGLGDRVQPGSLTASAHHE